MLTINIYRLTSIVQLFDEINFNCINYKIESDSATIGRQTTDMAVNFSTLDL